MRVIFVTVADDRRGLESLTRLLFSTFPGSTVYQHGSVANAIRDVLHNRVDALFVRAAHGHEMLQMLRRQKPELPVFLLTDGEDTCIPYSDTGQEILDALRPAIAATAQSEHKSCNLPVGKLSFSKQKDNSALTKCWR